MIDTPALYGPPETSLTKIFTQINEIPESMYDQVVKFLDEILQRVNPYPEENLIRKNLEETKEIQMFFENTRGKSMTKVKMVIGSIGQVAKGVVKLWRISRDTSSQDKVTIQLMKSLRELDPSIPEEIKAFVDNMLNELKGTNLQSDHIFRKAVCQVKMLMEIFAATGGHKPSKELLKDNPWISEASAAFLPVVCQNLALATEFANIIRSMSA